jgi:hypothetical protein
LSSVTPQEQLARQNIRTKGGGTGPFHHHFGNMAPAPELGRHSMGRFQLHLGAISEEQGTERGPMATVSNLHLNAHAPS